MRLSTILESAAPNKIWHDKWYDTKWADQVTVREKEHPIKVIYSKLFEDAFADYPAPIIEYMMVEHNYLQGGNTILDSVNWSDVDELETWLDENHPSPDEMHKELVSFGAAFNQLYEELKKNDQVLHKTIETFDAYDHNSDQLIDALGAMSKALGRLDIYYFGDDKMTVEPLTPSRTRPLMGLFGTIKTKYSTIRYPIETMLSDKLILEIWHEMVMTPGIFGVIHTEGFLPKTKKAPCLGVWK